MKKRFVLFLIISILLSSTILYISPLSVWATSYYLENQVAFELNNGHSGNVSVYPLASVMTSTLYNYTEATSWTTPSRSTSRQIKYQLPTPFASRVQISSSTYWYLSNNVQNRSVLALGGNGDFIQFVDGLTHTSDDYFCMALPIITNRALGQLKVSFAYVVTGNSYSETDYYVEDRMLVYNPGNVAGITQSGVIDSTIWDTSSWGSSYAMYLIYCNLPYSELETYYQSLQQTNICISFSWSSSANYYYAVYEPIYFVSRADLTLNVVQTIGNDVTAIRDLFEDLDSSAWYNPPNLTSLSLDDMQALDDKFSINAVNDSIWQPIRNGFASREIINGLAFAGTLVTWVYDRLGFLTPIFGILLWLIILNALRGTIVSTMHKSDSEATFQKHREQMNEDREAYLKRWGK